MRYLGGKYRFGKHYCKIFNYYRKTSQAYVEPFCGGGNMIVWMDGERYANDTNIYVVSALRALSEGWLPPPKFTKEEYDFLRKNPDRHPKKLVGFAGCSYSFGGKFLDIWATDNAGRDYVFSAYTQAKRVSAQLRGIVWSSGDYRQFQFPAHSLLYCDPPYFETTSYTTGKFDSAAFADWTEEMKDAGHTVFISEYTQLSQRWKLLCEHKTVSMIGDKKSKRTEKLFIVQ